MCPSEDDGHAFIVTVKVFLCLHQQGLEVTGVGTEKWWGSSQVGICASLVILTVLIKSWGTAWIMRSSV